MAKINQNLSTFHVSSTFFRRISLNSHGFCMFLQGLAYVAGSSGHMLFVSTLLASFLLLVPQGIPADLMLLFLGAMCCLFGVLESKVLFRGCASEAVPRRDI